MAVHSVNSLVSLLSTAVSARSSLLGRAIHAHIVKTLRHPLPALVYDHLTNMYAKMNLPSSAQLVLQLNPTRSVVSWTSLISGSVQNGHFSFSLLMFIGMLKECIRPNDFTFPCAFKASGGLCMPVTGKQIHGIAVKVGEIVDVFVGCSALDMYCKTGLKDDARKLFDEMPQKNRVAWNTYISNAVLDGMPQDGISAFLKFRRVGGVPDYITLCAFFNACSDTANLELGHQLHGYVFRSGFEVDISVANGLVDFYGKCGEVGCSEMVFDEMREPNDVSWCSLMSTLVQNHEQEKACMAFLMARKEGIRPTDFLVSSVLHACAGLAGLELGRSVHALANKVCVMGNIFVGTALVDMYGKCGCVEDAEGAFHDMPQRNLITWNSLIGCYAHQGLADMAVAVFEKMLSSCSETIPNNVTFVCLLAACSRAGNVELGMDIFRSMRRRYAIEAGPEHYTCIVDLLGRAGMLEQAYDFIMNMPFRPTISIWGALLGACRIHRNPELGRIAAENLFQLDPKDSGNFVVLSNSFAASGRWEEATSVRKEIKDIGLKKGTGCSWITVKNEVHIFQAKDTSHERNSEIHATLSELKRDMEEAGYIADPTYSLYDLEEEEKVSEVWLHSEKIALAFGLVSIPPVVPIRIMKNLRMCGDCHSAFKFVSRTTGREIIVRDNARFHRFQDGHCSCKDFW
ncbi:pentatricopeptide repeat-containing protein At4g14850 [Rhodamnia argentea]|uniref:Pentatricopeptide repeat-containing protein At4g14850 n=1 Tax=Rhodamnia argentea TaxID=178133 RepID=A0A8B8Q8E3_9MYRT|nr:pentatricopeptide repeat-containing protein At4g14850 [Rhodamnia argentea]